MTTQLSTKQALFVREYLLDLNATQAAIRAGYSPRSAAAAGSRLLKQHAINNAIEQSMAERIEKTQRTALCVLQDIQRLTREAWAEGDLKTTLKGLELEGKHLGMFKDKVDTTINGGMTISWQE